MKPGDKVTLDAYILHTAAHALCGATYTVKAAHGGEVWLEELPGRFDANMIHPA